MDCKVCLALGSNLGDREQTLNSAVNQISRLASTTVNRVSQVYETEPVGYLDQGKFLNIVIEICTDLDPESLLEGLQEIEFVLDRKREIRWGPRTIDIDILLYGDSTISLPQLEIPHPRMFERAFVLIPLMDVLTDEEKTKIGIVELIKKCNDREGISLYKKPVTGN